MLAFRPLIASDQSFLRDIMRIALWDPPPAPLRPREVLDHPAVRIYVENWGAAGDVGVVATVDGGVSGIGACWMRNLSGGQGLAYVDDQTPQLGIALLPPHQRLGYGKHLMLAALDAACIAGYRQVSLTVHPQNPAIAMYEKCGFSKVGLRNTFHLMIVRF